MITTHRGIAGIWSIPARPSRIFEVSWAIFVRVALCATIPEWKEKLKRTRFKYER
jgi:hypothetical protein